TPTRGTITIDGRDVTRAPPEARNIAQVFQFPVIYDTMSVFENLAFPLQNRGVRGQELNKRVERIAELLELSPWLKQRATSLSADMKQRISLARGLVRTDVAAILLDEPLTVIDPHAKWLLRRKLKQMHAELKVTLVYVTHDQVEALTLADQVLVMKDGRILQQGTPQELFERPRHTFVGYFIGSPGMNLLPCLLTHDAVVIDGQRLAMPAERLTRARAAGGEMVVGIRPELVKLGPQQSERSLRCTVGDVQPLGHATLVSVRIGPHKLTVRTDAAHLRELGAEAHLTFPEESTLLYCDGQAVS
ncbi:MAG TPA: ABC transporter ATP-binding protein, partial [Polyangiales bacterium]|nr:ABC transporter ATP-binding protein [Polyangiales bacterium]